MPRVTNSDINDRLIRLEEVVKPVVEGISRVISLQEQQIRTEGALKEHDSKINVLFDQTEKLGTSVDQIKSTDTPHVNNKVDKHISADRAVIATLTAVMALVMAVIGYFVNQQSSALHDIADNTSKTAAAAIALDKRLTIAEYQLSNITRAPASAPGGAK